MSLNWDHECFTTETHIKLTDNSTANNSKLDSNKWKIQFSDHYFYEDTSELDIMFGYLDTYPIEYVIVSQFGCSDTANKNLVLKPTYPIYKEDYYEDFTDGKSDWTENKDDPDGPNSWTFGAPTGNIFNAPYERAWYTDIEVLHEMENSYVLSPCFDFSEAERPMIKLDIWQAFAFNVDGAVLEYQTMENKTWFTVGNINEGENWYTSGTIRGVPGVDGTGWTAENPVDTFQTAKHMLDDILKDQGLVRFRIAYGAPETLPSDAIERDGFAFDRIWIGERTKKVLVEYFTNMGVDATIMAVNEDFNNVINSVPKDVIDIQYHMNHPGPDVFYEHDPVSSNSRDLYYSNPTVPFAIIDGGRNNNRDFMIDFESDALEREDLDLAVLKDNEFDIDMEVTKGNQHLNVDLTITSLINLDQKYITVHVVIIENRIKDVVSDWGESEFESVVRAMLPDAAGTSFNIIWNPGTTQNVNVDYFYDNIYKEDEIRVVAFVQDNDTREVYQAVIDNPYFVSELEENRINRDAIFKVYPNPAKGYINVKFIEPLPEETRIEIADNSGRLVRIYELNSGAQIHSINLNEYEPGMYIVRLIRDKELVETRKLVILGNDW